MKLRTLPKKLNLRNKRILVRVDWNVPLQHDAATQKSEKIVRTLPLLKELRKRGAVVLLMTHLGRPEGREQKYSTKPLARMIRHYTGLPITYLDADLSSESGGKELGKRVATFKGGDIVCLENVRFQPGEEKNDKQLAKRYAAVADVFINDAFASCHRAHVSVVGVAKLLPAYAGPALQAEVEAVSHLFTKVKRPYYAFIGGAKLSTKIEVVETLLRIADKVFIGGAMANPFLVAKRLQVGKSLMEKTSVPIARKLLKNKKLVIPTDVIVAPKIAKGVVVRRADVSKIKKSEMIGDIGTETICEWVDEINHAETLVWNGPLGVTELPSFSHGSSVIATALALRAKGRPYVLVGGGDTLPVMAKTGMEDMVDFVSTGGGAMLEFIAAKGKLPGLKPLQGT